MTVVFELNTKGLVLKKLKGTIDTSEYISGEQISNELQISRTAVWKQIQELKKDGYMITSYPNKGYILESSPDILIKEEITPYLNTSVFGRSFYYHKTIDSTNTTAKILAENDENEGAIIVAEEQLNGKGRLGRTWVSPLGKGIYTTIIVRPKIPVHQASQLTLVVATVIAKVLNEQYNIPAKIKWPNDIIANDKKIAGILVEMSSDLDQINYAVIGIGLNVNHSLDSFGGIDPTYTPTSMAMEASSFFNRAEVMIQLINDLEKAYMDYIETGFQGFKPIWEQYAFSINKTINVYTGTTTIVGTLLGINETGALVIDVNGTIQTIYSGELTVS